MKTTIILISIILVLQNGCKKQEDTTMDMNNPEISEKTAYLLEAENEFGFELFRQVYAEENDSENIMISPLSVSIALAMTYNGAREETKTAMEKTLKVYGLTPEDINDSYFKLVSALKSLDNKVLLEIANAIFYRQDFKVEQEFVSTNKTYYDASVSALDFGAQQKSLEAINGWVKEKTHDKIESIIQEINPGHVMFLLNAIYFKGIWQQEFDKKSTQPLRFTTGEGRLITPETMQGTDTLPYYTNDLFSAVKMPYGKGNYNMFIFLPHPEKALEEVIQKLDEENWNKWMEGFSGEQSVDIKLPRFKYEYEIKLNDVLTKMGMGIAFTGSANFSGINREGGLLIDYVKHKTFIEVNEEGTEAAAVTVAGILRTSVEMPQRPQFVVNRPFFYAITENSTGAVLFMGTIKNPASD